MELPIVPVLPLAVRVVVNGWIRRDWNDDAACASTDHPGFHSEDLTEQAKVAAEVCGTCPVRRSCLASALLHDEAGRVGRDDRGRAGNDHDQTGAAVGVLDEPDSNRATGGLPHGLDARPPENRSVAAVSTWTGGGVMRINGAQTATRDLVGPELWELRRTDPVAYRSAVVDKIRQRCAILFGACLLSCGRCFTYPHFDDAVTVTCHVADCPEHGQAAA